MKLGILTVPFSGMPLEKALDYLAPLGVEAVELGTGGYTNPAHCDVRALIQHPEKARELRALVEGHGMTIAALSCHANPVHPDPDIARQAHQVYTDTLQAAQLLGVDTVVCFSGCPGGAPGDTSPNWITCAWPTEFGRMLDYQWNECLLPYWTRAAEMARAAGVKIAIEMHPGFSVYSPDTLLRLRAGAGDVIGANFDPSHLFWQGMDGPAAIRRLGPAIHYVHAKDCRIEEKTKASGALDTTPYDRLGDRAWSFCTVGYGHGADTWKHMLAQLRLAGYDGTVSIEHEDALLSVNEGVEKAVAFLKDLIPRQAPCAAWWT